MTANDDEQLVFSDKHRRVSRVVIGRGIALTESGAGPAIGYELWCYGMATPAKFAMGVDHAERFANMILDSVRKHREGEAG